MILCKTFSSYGDMAVVLTSTCYQRHKYLNMGRGAVDYTTIQRKVS